MTAERVQKLLSQAGITSRRKAEELIEQGKVRVNGKRITVGDKATIQDTITVDGKVVKFPSRYSYYAFHKPVKCVTTASDPERRKTIYDYIKVKERVIPVGRLDFHTSGLLLLTNDGEFANRIMHPRYEVEKTYRVYVKQPVKESGLSRLRAGVVIEGKKTYPAKAYTVNSKKDIVDITIHEGRNRIVRKMFETLGYEIQALVRTAVGGIRLANLPVGKVRKLTKQEVEHLKNLGTHK